MSILSVLGLAPKKPVRAHGVPTPPPPPPKAKAKPVFKPLVIERPWYVRIPQ